MLTSRAIRATLLAPTHKEVPHATITTTTPLASIGGFVYSARAVAPRDGRDWNPGNRSGESRYRWISGFANSGPFTAAWMWGRKAAGQ